MMVLNWFCGISIKRTDKRKFRRLSQWPTDRVLRLALAAGLLTVSVSGLAQTTAPAAGSVAPAAQASPVLTVPADTKAAQPGAWQLVRTVALAQPGPASLDRRGNLYVTDGQNNLHQYGPDGQTLNTFSPPLPGHTAQVEAWNTTKVLVFYDDRQELVLLDRFMAPITKLTLLDFFDGMVRAATLAPDDRYWLLNESDLTLRQLDASVGRFTITTPLDILIGRSRPDFRFLREYQNNLYLVDHNNGIYVFDNLGNYRKKLPFSGLSTIGFRGDELYFLANDGMHFFHLYNLTERTVALPAAQPGSIRQVLMGEQYAYVFTGSGLQVYHL
ncbi:hypothetical protein SAMN06265337_2785 [Hymenobacter gelipurpurascens]|uniref:NHL repeat-containing protein n=1 Tax=Hymenobacter gelipurpurascens TaxID=89968 RepID=A0A212UAS5_9BACT|nr:hypothetical protein [Hymenobacter gelipurpurascens]SNC75260.1 hypothetical protein SAMN06265337_2785 [Hymenobacter gelipurpurascens]